uniref:Uncharacterized protein n=1 Tax=Salix viminalis TaxID=40686 RepID=A0A6N2NC51_SALVM
MKRFDWSHTIHEHVTHMSNLASRLTFMGMEVHESFLVQFIINSLPPEYGQFQMIHCLALKSILHNIEEACSSVSD